MMQDIELYQNIVIGDREFPAQLLQNHILKKGPYFPSHWHEQAELHYILKGESDLYCNQTQYHVSPGDLLVINGNELHHGICTLPVHDSLVLIFRIDDFSGETAGRHLLFEPLIQKDAVIGRLFHALFEEERCQRMGYKLSMKGKILELIVYLMRHYVTENLTEQESMRRGENLRRLNVVLHYLEENYMHPITAQDMARLVNLSPGRFAHLFKDSMGLSPGAYLNQLRLKKAHNLLKQGTLTSTEAAFAVGFSDYNNFGRQFKRQYHLPPSQI